MRRQLSRNVGERNISYGEYLVLRRIADSRMPHPRAARLSNALDMSRPALSRILNALEERGFITRSIDTTDRRGITLAITEKGRQELEAATGATLIKAEQVAYLLGEEETETLIRLLDRLSDILKELSETQWGDSDA